MGESLNNRHYVRERSSSGWPQPQYVLTDHTGDRPVGVASPHHETLLPGSRSWPGHDWNRAYVWQMPAFNRDESQMDWRVGGDPPAPAYHQDALDAVYAPARSFGAVDCPTGWDWMSYLENGGRTDMGQSFHYPELYQAHSPHCYDPRLGYVQYVPVPDQHQWGVAPMYGYPPPPPPPRVQVPGHLGRSLDRRPDGWLEESRHVDCKTLNGVMGAFQDLSIDPLGRGSWLGEGVNFRGTRSHLCKVERKRDWVNVKWGGLVHEILSAVFQLLNVQDMGNCRLVCAWWRDAVDSSVVELKPTWLKSKNFIRRFSFLKRLDLAKCPHVRNRDLMIVTEGVGQLKQLGMGSAANPPFITNRGLEKLGSMTSLTTLKLNDCAAITNNGLAALSSLTMLSTLSLKGCIKINSKGMQQLQKNTSLTSLNLYGCCRVGDRGMLWLSELPNMAQLLLGNTRVRDEGLRYIARMTTLRELFVYGEDVNDTGIRELHPLKNLERLTLRETFNLRGEGIAELVRNVNGLKYLDLCDSEMDDESFIIATYDWCRLEALDLRGCFISEPALNEITQLTSLKSLAIEPFWDVPVPQSTNFVFSNFTTLTHLGLVGDTVTVEMVQAICKLPHLRELAIADHVFSENLITRHPLEDLVVAELATLTNLRVLDVARRCLTVDQVFLLADNLRSLKEICIYGCQVDLQQMQELQKRFPDVQFYKDIMKDGVLDVHHAPGFVWAGQPGNT